MLKQVKSNPGDACIRKPACIRSFMPIVTFLSNVVMTAVVGDR